MNVRTRAAALAAVAALATAPWLASPAAAASVMPSPAPVPTIAPAQPTSPPIPTPPPNQGAASCTDTSVTGFLLVGRFPIPASSSVSATTEIQILPDTSDARFYLNYTIAQLKQEEAQAQAQQQAAPVKSVSPAPLDQTAQRLVQQQADATRLSTVLQNLQPVMRGTTVGPFGFWSCSGVPPAASYLLFATLSTTKTVATQATPPPIPAVVPAAVAAAIRQNFGQRQQTTRYYYKMTLRLNPLKPKSKAPTLNFDFWQWQHVATISQ
jgi:hypothetical protein